MSSVCSRFIKTLILIALTLPFTSPALAAGDEVRGRELINSSGCKGCHKIEGQGGSLGPALDGVGKRLTPEQLRQQLVNPKARNPSSTMPSFSHLPNKDIQALVDFLEGLK
jgi:cbb3-type cytochrome oxidase cytochrome c subunit